MEQKWWKSYLSPDGRSLDLRGKELTSLEGLALSRKLRELYLGGTKLTSLEGVTLPQGLWKLDLRRTALTSLAGVDLPQGLQELYLGDTKLTSLKDVTLPQELRRLYLNDTKLTSLKDVALPQELQELYLTRTKLTSLEGVSLPQDLQRLDLDDTELTSLEGVTLPQGLQVLNLSRTKLTSLEGVSLPQGLQHLFLGGTELTNLDGVTLPQGLQWLDLSRTKLTSLDRVDLPQGLQLLELSRTGLTRLPESIRRLKDLHILDLTRSNLETLPDWLPELGLPFLTAPFGEGIRLFETTVKGVDMSIFDQSQEDILRWFEARKKQDDAPLNEIKVVFLGNGDVGKTHTIARLMKDGAKPDESFTGESTPGIAISDKTYKISGQDIRVHFWDFGGQEILYAMHRMFMTDRTIYVILVDARNNNRGAQAKEWLDTVKSFAREAPIVLVVNKTDQNPAVDLDKRGLMEKYPNLRDVIYMSAKKMGKQEFNKTFTAVLRDMIGKSDVPKMKWPKNWKKVKDALQSMKDPYIRGGKYEEICRDCGVEKDGESLLNWCNDLGVCFRREDKRLKDYVILRPEWITNAVYTIIFNKRDAVHNGLISWEDIFDLLTSPGSRQVLKNIDYTWQDMEYVLGVIRHFHLSYQFKGEEKEFFPMLCREDSSPVVPGYANAPDTLEFHVEFEYLPNNILHRLMVERYAELDQDNVWLTGARFLQPDAGLSAVVIIEDKKLKLYVRTENPLHPANTYLSVISGTIDRICKDLNLEVSSKWLIYKVGGRQHPFDYEELLQMLDDGEETAYASSLDRPYRKPRIEEVLKQLAPAEVTEQERLVWQLVQLCADMQADSLYWEKKENIRNTYLRNGLNHMEYIVRDQTLRGISGTGSAEGELDLDIRKFDNIPWTICEALRVKGVEKASWDDHLNRLLKNYNSNGLRFLIQVTYVDSTRQRFMEIVKDFKDHVRMYAPEGFRVATNSFHYYSAEPWKNYQFIRTSRCEYRCGDYQPTVYHIFVRMGE